jgi:hypothetical protein
MYSRYQQDITELQAQRIVATSAYTYKVGAGHFNRFLVEQGVSITDLLDAPVGEIRYTAMCFVTYLSQLKKRDGQPLSHTTIDQYVTHAIFYLTNIGVIDSTFDFRCPGTKRLLNAVERRDAHLRGPLRERISIALSLPLINKCIEMAQETYQCKITVAFITAALYFGYMFSVRPDDYLVPVADDFHRIRACSIAFWFFGYSKPFFAHQLRPPFQFPPSGSLPVRCSVIIDFDKANGSGTAGMRACCSNPIPGQFCFVSWLYNF